MPLEHCEHVYRNMKENPCELCGKDTHATDFKLVAEMHKKWWEEGKADWSVCKDCGGTIRGWWSI